MNAFKVETLKELVLRIWTLDILPGSCSSADAGTQDLPLNLPVGRDNASTFCLTTYTISSLTFSPVCDAVTVSGYGDLVVSHTLAWMHP